MRILLMCGVGLLVATPVFADTIIYRKSDRLVAGIAPPTQSVEVEMQNILTSAGFAGSAREDFALATLADKPRGHRIVIDPDGTARTEPRPEEEQPIDIPIEDFGAGVAGAFAVLGGRGLVVKVMKKRVPPV